MDLTGVTEPQARSVFMYVCCGEPSTGEETREPINYVSDGRESGLSIAFPTDHTTRTGTLSP